MLSDGTPHETVADLRAWQKRSSPIVVGDEAKTLWFQATQTPVLRGRPRRRTRLLGAPPASRAPGLRERRGGCAARRGLSRRGGERSAIFGCCERLAGLKLPSERLGGLFGSRNQRRARPRVV